MVSTRRKALPPHSTPPTNSSKSLAEVGPTKPYDSFTSASDQDSTKASVLFSRAEALARMTYEMNIRTLEGQVKSLEKDVRAVVQETAEDKKFRTENEARLSKLWQEMLVVRQQMAKVEETQGNEHAEFEACQKETQELVKSFRDELTQLKAFLDDISKHMECLPTPPSSLEARRHSAVLDNAVNTTNLNETQQLSPDKSSGSQECVDATVHPQARNNQNNATSIDRRIEETIKSTKRWNRDHKTTALPDYMFCASYLKQQSKRDAAMAVHIQKSIGKRIRARLRRSHSRPSTLEEFCRHVEWQDVVDTVQHVLEVNRQATIEELSGKRT
ncbi:hypothetical protein ACRE_041800 [Hapsidospora chrysogenum ATCC 11550]|uniref:Uncharacterized protein n=1 Tax=Hapsidospora chrysogenum (strain ATCC 11550 / CBS 779.69 / DSM 880 / IAM 14645 / JCM 23072 / IMI 49137) TaxID=857340 RepID=A0A086T6K9_HAPC1|nr:hypothetical protein ACRE_041800 [Hapsidospora chrysogenum ATCC 11550]